MLGLFVAVINVGKIPTNFWGIISKKKENQSHFLKSFFKFRVIPVQFYPKCRILSNFQNSESRGDCSLWQLSMLSSAKFGCNKTCTTIVCHAKPVLSAVVPPTRVPAPAPRSPAPALSRRETTSAWPKEQALCRGMRPPGRGSDWSHSRFDTRYGELRVGDKLQGDFFLAHP